MNNEKVDISISIVLYNNEERIIRETIQSVVDSKASFKLYLVDNSPEDKLRKLAKIDERVEYIFNNKNVGFGRGHNMILNKTIYISKYHLILNPDVYFDNGVLEKILFYMNNNGDVGQLMPKILYPDRKLQFLCKLLPTPVDLIGRRFLGFLPSVKKRDSFYELRCSGYNKVMNVPYLSGCFMFLRCEALKKIGLFDEKIFMYIEDADLTRRIHQFYKTIFYPDASIYHHYAKGSYKNLKLMLYNIHGAWIYFNKWGWFFDKDRKDINRKVLNKYCS